jgi:hypothetical protein
VSWSALLPTVTQKHSILRSSAQDSVNDESDSCRMIDDRSAWCLK